MPRPPRRSTKIVREKVSITKTTLAAAVPAAREGVEAEWLDPTCPGMELRARAGGSVSWTL